MPPSSAASRPTTLPVCRCSAVDVDDDQAGALEYARTQALGFPLLLDPQKAVARAYLVDNLPMTILIDRAGSVRQVHRDFSSKFEPAFLQQLRVLLNE